MQVTRLINGVYRSLSELIPGQDITHIAFVALAFGLSLDDRDFFESLNGIQRELDDFEQNQKHGLSLKP